jgi:hypothetical protein
VTAEPHAPLLTPVQATALLERVLCDQILECVDLDALYRVEQSLVTLVGELEGVPIEHAGDLAQAMLDDALLRIPDDARRYLRTMAVLAIDHCALCDEDARSAESAAERQSPTRTTR